MLPRRTGGAVRPIRAESRNVTDVPRGRPSRGLSYRGGIAFGLAVVEAMLPRRTGGAVRPIRAESRNVTDVPRAVYPTEEVSRLV